MKPQKSHPQLPSLGIAKCPTLGILLKLNLDFIKFKLDLYKFKFNFIKFKFDFIKSNFSFKNVCGFCMLMLALKVLCSSYTKPTTVPSSTDQEVLKEWRAATVVSDEAVKEFGIDSCFKAYPISDAIFSRMDGKSYKKNCTVPRSSLRYLRVLHRNVDGKTQLGEIVCNQAIANDLLEIFRELYKQGYKIERITLIDDYDADDERSMAANNTSCFNFRVVSGTTKLSNHAQGRAIDINPLYNPYIHLNNGKVEPANGKPYATNRTASRKIPVPFINTSDLCYRLFIQHGFRWGGAWRTVKDYQHFDK